MGKTKNNIKYCIIFSFLLGCFCFCLLYGVKIINPSYDDWLLMDGGDITNPYLAWIKYRNTPINFPVGLADGLLYPSKCCITFTDSIPLFAIIFKILSLLNLLPSVFQYWGIWGLFCFGMQGAVGFLIMYKATDNKVYSFIASLFFIFSPLVIFRMYFHTSLAGQWIILIAFYEYFFHSQHSNLEKTRSWSLICIVASLIHIYFIPMVIFIMAAEVKSKFVCKLLLGTCGARGCSASLS
jgi:hypothetical protein